MLGSVNAVLDAVWTPRVSRTVNQFGRSSDVHATSLQLDMNAYQWGLSLFTSFLTEHDSKGDVQTLRRVLYFARSSANAQIILGKICTCETNKPRDRVSPVSLGLLRYRRRQVSEISGKRNGNANLICYSLNTFFIAMQSGSCQLYRNSHSGVSKLNLCRM